MGGDVRKCHYTVTELTDTLKQTLARVFQTVWVVGEVGSVTLASSGHCYFSLKDANSQLQCVWWKSRQQTLKYSHFHPITGEVLTEQSRVDVEMLKKGGEFLCAGTLSIYAKRGEYQLNIETIVSTGLGRLTIEYERLKKELEEKGYFARERKRLLPKYAARIALVTSLHGAAIRDFWRIAQTRGLSAQISLYPTLVQGAGAAKEIAAAISLANQENWAEVIVLIRGGGSLEDLWSFNEREVADAVFTSKIPVLAGIGHEIDDTLADKTADLRAATPTHAAELLFPERDALLREVTHRAQHLSQIATLFWQKKEALYQTLTHRLKAKEPVKKVALAYEKWSNLEQRLSVSMAKMLHQRETRLLALHGRLLQTVVSDRFDALLSKVLQKEEQLKNRIAELIRIRLEQVDALAKRAEILLGSLLEAQEKKLLQAAAKLESASPTRLLAQGYAMVEDSEKRFVSTLSGIKVGDTLRIHLSNGSLLVQVSALLPDSENK